jgi:hypothetical protein
VELNESTRKSALDQRPQRTPSAVTHAHGKYFIHGCDGGIDDLALEGFEYDCLVFDGELCESDPRNNLSGADIDLLMVEDADNIPVLSRTRSLNVGEEFMFEVRAHIRPEERRM